MPNNTYKQKTNRTIDILLIEDDPDDALLVKEELDEGSKSAESNIEFNLSHAVRLSEALDLISQRKFDLVLLDLSLPDSIGIDTFNKVHSRAPSLPVIVLTGSQLSREPLRDCLNGASGYLLKGYTNPDSLVQSILKTIPQ